MGGARSEREAVRFCVPHTCAHSWASVCMSVSACMSASVSVCVYERDGNSKILDTRASCVRVFLNACAFMIIVCVKETGRSRAWDSCVFACSQMHVLSWTVCVCVCVRAHICVYASVRLCV